MFPVFVRRLPGVLSTKMDEYILAKPSSVQFPPRKIATLDQSWCLDACRLSVGWDPVLVERVRFI